MRPANPNQRGLQTFAGVMFLPNTGAVGTGAGLGVWNVTGAPTITHPAPTSTSLATQFSRTVYTEIGATNNQVLGPVGANYQFWKGNAANMGGFYFAAMFTIDAWNNDAGRLFVGLASAAAGTPVNADAWPAGSDGCGLWHDSTMGANVLKFLHVDNGTMDTSQAVTGATLAAGQGFLWEIWGYPNQQSVINTNHRLTSINTGLKIDWNVIGGGPRIGVFCAPQVTMSNGTDATAGHFGIGVINCYAHTAPTPTTSLVVQ